MKLFKTVLLTTLLASSLMSCAHKHGHKGKKECGTKKCETKQCDLKKEKKACCAGKEKAKSKS